MIDRFLVYDFVNARHTVIISVLSAFLAVVSLDCICLRMPRWLTCSSS